MKKISRSDYKIIKQNISYLEYRWYQVMSEEIEKNKFLEKNPLLKGFLFPGTGDQSIFSKIKYNRFTKVIKVPSNIYTEMMELEKISLQLQTIIENERSIVVSNHVRNEEESMMKIEDIDVPLKTVTMNGKLILVDTEPVFNHLVLGEGEEQIGTNITVAVVNRKMEKLSVFIPKFSFADQFAKNVLMEVTFVGFIGQFQFDSQTKKYRFVAQAEKIIINKER